MHKQVCCRLWQLISQRSCVSTGVAGLAGQGLAAASADMVLQSGAVPRAAQVNGVLISASYHLLIPTG